MQIKSVIQVCLLLHLIGWLLRRHPFQDVEDGNTEDDIDAFAMLRCHCRVAPVDMRMNVKKKKIVNDRFNV